MWSLRNLTPYAAERNWVLDKNASKSWLVVVKATYEILPGGVVKLSEQQEPALLAAEYNGEPGQASLRYEGDCSGPKRGTDILLNGHAYAPHGKPSPKVQVSLRVENFTKQLMVFGDRHWRRGLLAGVSMSSPKPFVSMPILYERAYGGWDRKSKDQNKHRLYSPNPVGTGFATKAEHLLGVPLPNIEYPGRLISSWKDRPLPAGFGPVASYWSPRLEFAGTYDEQWQETRAPLLAADFDERYYQCAPFDQQAPVFLRGGEKVELLNLTPNGGLSFYLPKVRLNFVTWFGRDSVEHRADLCTIIIEPDVPRLIMVWQTLLPCHHKVDKLDQTVIREKEYRS